MAEQFQLTIRKDDVAATAAPPSVFGEGIVARLSAVVGLVVVGAALALAAIGHQIELAVLTLALCAAAMVFALSRVPRPPPRS
jgi:hypothetical protein